MVVNPQFRYRSSGTTASTAGECDGIEIRGRHLRWDELVDSRLFDPAYVETLREQVCAARPYAHLVSEGWFHPTLLELVFEEFDLGAESGWKQLQNRYEATRRSTARAQFGPATQIYFSIVNSGWFVELLATINGLEHLIPDPMLDGGGLHETRPGGAFGVHRDFERHQRYGLKNELVFITYLNKGWNPDWNGGLELWDGEKGRCVRTVQPDFGRSIMLKHGPNSYHGHPRPLTVPDGRVRRSVATYYYSNPHAKEQVDVGATSTFLYNHRADVMKRTLKLIAPPIFWLALRKLTAKERS